MLIRTGPVQSPSMTVTFHGARTGKTKLPYFLRVRSSIDDTSPFVLFSDPTLGLDSDNLLSWFSGTIKVDVDASMEAVIRRVASLTKSPSLVLEGSSGGGFVAMRMAARFASAVAVVFSPQTDIFKYHPRFAHRVREAFYDFMPEICMKETFPGRFNVADIYASGADRGNLVLYAQNDGDEFHVRQHLNPMLLCLGSSSDASESIQGRMLINRDDLGEGHFPHPPELWDETVKSAKSWLFSHINATQPIAVYEEEMYATDELRQRRLREHCRARYGEKSRIGSWFSQSKTSRPTSMRLVDDAEGGCQVKAESRNGKIDLLIRAGVRSSGGVLRVFLHGPIDPAVSPYPTFDHRFSVHDDELNLEVFVADPTLAGAARLRVGWYLGSESWDPIPELASCLRELESASGASRVLIVGASSAGFAALRLAATSLSWEALLFCPELSVRNLKGSFVTELLKAKFPSHQSFSTVGRAELNWQTILPVLMRSNTYINRSARQYMEHLNSIERSPTSSDALDLLLNLAGDQEVFQNAQTTPTPHRAHQILREIATSLREDESIGY